MFPGREIPVELRVAKLVYRGTEVTVPVDRFSTVAGFKATFGKKLGLPYRSKPFCNGLSVGDGYCPVPGDLISFVELGPCEC